MTARKEVIAKKRAALQAKGLSREEVNRRIRQYTLSVDAQVGKNATAVQLRKQTAKGMAWNPYLAALLDPQHSEVIGVPDAFAELVHMSKIVHVHQCVFNSGQSEAIIQPDIQNFIRATASSSSVSLMTEVFNIPQATRLQTVGKIWAEYKNDHWSDDRILNRKPTTATYSAFPLAFPLTDSAGNEMAIQPIIAGNGESLKGLPVTAGVGSISIRSAWEVISAANVTPTAVFLLSNGTFVNTAGTQLAATPGVEQTTTIPVHASAAYFCGIYFAVTASLGDVLGRVFTIADVTTPVAPGTMAVVPIGNNGEYDTLTSAGKTYRVAALSVWAQYSGSLTSNGKIAIGLVQKRDGMLVNAGASFDRLAVTPGAHIGNLSSGGYAFYKPIGEADMEFRVVGGADGENRPLPYLAVSVKANDADAQNVTLVVCAHVEVQTVNQAMGPRPSIVDPPMIWRAQAELAYLDTGMENSNHLRTIANILRKSSRIAGTLLTAGGGVATALGQLEIAAPMAAAGQGLMALGKIGVDE
jgi:hypothetical protein